MLKQDGTLCSFSLCMEQVQRSCETLRSDFIEIYGPLKYCSACMKSVNGKWITRRSMMGIPVHALHARGGRLQVKQVWGTMQVLRQSWLGHLLKLEGILDI
ncbi:hypothetical protein V6Z11_A09G000700 [Gossypium hirsutum]|uniref:tRNA (adenine(58)-N(1))-methyltransferase catalytic subunit TRM61 C-terminal domain-containing protein n=1 Tax=Gossypium tomentosum TaxID=34277 RepID=A0A5D2NY79_GOSTO|nr:hypothetical protein ES332_A09G000300v1 [Gossypium tomentosum]